jgi:uncharacterized protein (DUF2132 family)
MSDNVLLLTPWARETYEAGYVKGYDKAKDEMRDAWDNGYEAGLEAMRRKLKEKGIEFHFGGEDESRLD